MDEVIYLKTGKFEHQTVGKDFINPISFGEDFGNWIIQGSQKLVNDGFEFSKPIMEDFGHAIEVENSDEKFWIMISFAEEGPTEEDAHWVITVVKRSNFFKRLFGKEKKSGFDKLKTSVLTLLKSEKDIYVFSEEEWLSLAES